MTRIVIDNSKCTGCRLCATVCALSNEGVNNPKKSRVFVVTDWQYRLNAVLLCYQCPKAPCASACPVDAIFRDNGVVKIDYEKCIGCGVCIADCPFGVIGQYNNKVVKCELCGGEPQCVKFCETGALRLSLNDSGASTRLSLAQKKIKQLKEKIKPV